MVPALVRCEPPWPVGMRRGQPRVVRCCVCRTERHFRSLNLCRLGWRPQEPQRSAGSGSFGGSAKAGSASRSTASSGDSTCCRRPGRPLPAATGRAVPAAGPWSARGRRTPDAIGRLLAIEPRPDCIVITGDLVDTGHPDEYGALLTILRRCPIPVHLAAGNHDDPAALVAKFGDTRYLGNGVSASYAVEYPQATLVVANSCTAGSPAGYPGLAA